MSLEISPIVDGNERGPTLVFIQGWPDDASLWDDAVAVLAPTYRCVRVTLPNFDGRRAVRDGFTTEEIIDALGRVVRDAAKDGPVTLILHDWGAYWGHAVHHRHPELVERVVGIDVAPHFKPTALGALGIVTYQSWLYGAFMLGGPAGDRMTRAFAKIAKMPNAAERPLTAWMNYPYRNIWADLFSGRAAKLTKGYFPKCPLLFLYGAKKPFHFHSERWIEHVKSVGGEVHAVETGHWVPNHPAFVKILVPWLETTRAS